jgi:hypothetical protein
MANWGDWIFRSMSGDSSQPFVAIELGNPHTDSPELTSWSFTDPEDYSVLPVSGRRGPPPPPPPLSVDIEIVVTLPGVYGTQLLRQQITITESLPAGVW